jgi:predicted permease
VIAAILATVLGLTGVARDVAILQAAMPSAILTSILALEFEAEPAFVSGAVLVTTLLSTLTITVVIAYLSL